MQLEEATLYVLDPSRYQVAGEYFLLDRMMGSVSSGNGRVYDGEALFLSLNENVFTRK